MMLAFTIILVLGGAYLLIFKSTKKILRRVGQKDLMQISNVLKQLMRLLEHQRGQNFLLEQIFLSKFSNPSLIYAKRATSAGMLADLPRYALEAVAFGGMLLVMLYLVGQKGDCNSIAYYFSLCICRLSYDAIISKSLSFNDMIVFADCN